MIIRTKHKEPTAEPVSLKDIKEMLSIRDSNHDDALLRDIIAQCRSITEKWMGQIIADRDINVEVDYTYDNQEIELILDGPILSINSVSAYKRNAYKSDIVYEIDENRISFKSPEGCDKIIIIYRAGCMQDLDPSISGAIKEMMRIIYRRDGSDPMTDYVKRMLYRVENI